MHTHMTRAWVEIDLGALQQNGAALAARAGTPLLPMVKADAYGLGAVPVARALQPLHPWGFGISTVDEGTELRAAGIELPIVVFTPLARAELAAARQARLIPTLGTVGEVEHWTAVGGGDWFLAIDTGMHRAGAAWDDMDALAVLCRTTPPLSAFTHFHSAERDDGSVAEQERRFRHAVSRLPVRPPLLHAENSAAIVRRERSPWDVVRPGLFLYGGGSGAGAAIEPQPVVRLRAMVVDLQQVHPGETVSYGATYRAESERRVATLAIGYADGYPRSLSNRGVVLIHGQAAPVTGAVTMDMVMVDVTGIPCERGDVATLIGETGPVQLDRVAGLAGTISYEILTGLGTRLPRNYHGEGG